MKLAMLYVLIFPLIILGFSAWSAVAPLRRLVAQQRRPARALSEILYAYTSGAGNNGSAFAGLNANTPWYNTTLGLDDARRPLPDDRAGAGDRAARWSARRSCRRGRAPSPPTARLFVVLLVGVIVIVGALTFFPALAWARSSSTSSPTPDSFF